MKSSLVRTAIIVASIVVAGTALSGCAPAGPVAPPQAGPTSAGNQPTASATPSASPTATPTPAPFPANLGALPANALFRITAKGIQPNGATIDLVETVFAPVAPTPLDTTLLNAQCNMSGSPNWQTQFHHGYLYLDATFTATVDPTTPTFNTRATIAADMEDFLANAFSGAYNEAQATCAPGYFTLPGTIHGVAAVSKTGSATGDFGWANNQSRYGFYGDGNDPNDPNGGNGNTVVKDCAVQISPAALAIQPHLAAWQTQVYVKSKSCYYIP